MSRALLALGLLATACGGLDNRPLVEGGVRGTLALADPAVAVVALLGRPEVAARPTAAGDFEVRGLPTGEVELFAIATSTTALRRRVVVRGGEVLDLGVLQAAAAGSVKVKLRASHNQRLDGGRVEAVGTPLSGLAPTEEGVAVVGPLPEGCYELRAVVPGFGRIDQRACVTGTDELELELDLPDSDGAPGREGCLVAGCRGTSVCKMDGRCE